ncbi:MAG: hydrogenase iron-sulfur subunit [Eggerthella lenta]
MHEVCRGVHERLHLLRRQRADHRARAVHRVRHLRHRVPHLRARGASSNDAELLHTCRAAADVADGQVVIACDQLLAAADGLYDPAKVVGVTCLGRVEESLLVTLAARGARRVVLVQARCAECEHASGFETARLVRDTALALLETWNNEMRTDLVEKLPTTVRRSSDEGYDASRRSFFSSVKDEVRTLRR